MLNWTLFYTILDAQECSKALTQLLSIKHDNLPLRRLEFTESEGKKQHRGMQKLKQKGARSDFQLNCLQEKGELFIYNIDRSGICGSKDGSFSLTNSEFLETAKAHRLFGDLKLIKKEVILIETYQWESFQFASIALESEKTLLIVREINSSIQVNLSNTQTLNTELDKKINGIFDGLLELLFGQLKAHLMMEAYLGELKAVIGNHSQARRQVEKGVIEIQFLFIELAKICKCFMESRMIPQ